jgi:uncharacterized RDD family membrane protein YckC
VADLDATGEHAPDPPPGFRSAAARRQVKGAATLVGVLVGLVQLLLPIVLVVLAVASMVAACKESFSAPDVEASGAALHGGRVYYTVWRSGGKEMPSGAALMSVPADRAEPPRLEVVLPSEIRRFDRRHVVAHEGRIHVLSDDREAVLEAGHVAAPVKRKELGEVYGRPFLLDGRPTVARLHVESRPADRDPDDSERPAAAPRPDGVGRITLVSLREGDWAVARELHPVRVPAGARARTLQLVVGKGGPAAAFVSTDRDELYGVALSGSDLAGSPRPRLLAREVGDFAAVVRRGEPAVLVLSRPPGLEELVDALEGEQKVRPTTLRGLTLDGIEFLRTGVGRSRELAASPTGPDTFLLASRRSEGLARWTLRQDRLEAAVLPGRPRWMTVLGARLLALGGLWAAGDGLLVLLGAWFLATKLRRHRTDTFRGLEGTARLGSLVRRGLARTVDTALLVAVGLPVVYALHSRGWGTEAAAALVAVPGFVLLTVLQGQWGTSPGKALLGLRVLGTDLRPCGLGRSLVRELVWIVDGLCSGLVGLLVASMRPDWQRLGDSAARTVVVRAGTVDRPPVPPA